MIRKKLGDCGCLYKDEKTIISGSLEVGITIADSLIKTEKDEQQKKVYIEDRSTIKSMLNKVGNTPLCK